MVKQQKTLNMPQDLINDTDIVIKQLYQMFDKKYEENFADENYAKLYSLMKQAKVLRKVAYNRIINYKDHACVDCLLQLDNITLYFSEYEFDALEICPQAEDLKLKYIQYLKPIKEETKTL